MMRRLLKLGLELGLLILGLLVLPGMVSAFYITDWQAGLQVAVFLKLVELLVQPIVRLVLTPLNWLTLGVANLVVSFMLCTMAVAIVFQLLPGVGFTAPPGWLVVLQVWVGYAVWASMVFAWFRGR
jgi:uncharacterized membrane protein YvlD (DUF360 family)